MTAPTILRVIDNPQLFAPWFRKRETWFAWRVFLAALFGLPIGDGDRDLLQRCTGLDAPPPGGVTEAWLVCGRRAGKSFILALVAVYLAVFREWSEYLAPGERGTVKVIACDRKQARVIHRYCRALLTKVPAIAGLVDRDGDEEIDLSNGITVEIQTANFRSVRGYTLIAALCDEIAFWRSDESANPDSEILAALRPAMSTIPGAMLLCASSPYAKRGALWDTHRRHYGKPGPVLVWQADTRTMNPTVSERVIAEAYERDPASAADVVVRPPLPNVQYTAFADPSGGAGDSFTAAVAHIDDGVAVLDAL